LASAVHWTQRPLIVHIGVDVPAQSLLLAHCTQDDEAALQCGADAGHCESPVHPARQVRLSGSQIGADVPQSAFVVHLTQALRKQRGASDGQSVFVLHSTHCCVTASQTRRSVPPQSLDVAHPMHAPVMRLHVGVSPWQVPTATQAAWHW
jgi:hypothetical protein